MLNGHVKIRKIQLNFKPGNGYDRALEFLQSFLLPIKDTVAPVSLAPVRPQSSQAAYPSLAQPYKQPSTHTSRSTNSYIPTWQSQSSQYAYSSTSQQPMLQVSNFDEFPPDWIPSSAQPPGAVTRQPSVPEKSDQGIIKGAIASMPHHRLSKGTDWESETIAPAILGSREWRPVSAPETQCARETSDSCGLSQMLPPQRKLPFPETREEPPSRNNESLATVSQGLASEPKVVRNIPAKRKKAPSATRTQSAQAKASERNHVEKTLNNRNLITDLCIDQAIGTKASQVSYLPHLRPRFQQAKCSPPSCSYALQTDGNHSGSEIDRTQRY